MNTQQLIPLARRDAPTDDGRSARDDRVASALEEYAASVETGHPLSKEALLAKYGDVAAELRGCLDSLDFIRQVAPQLADAPAAPSHAGAEQPASSIESQNRRGDHPAPAPGLLGDFRILREIGRGGMGVVYEAEQISLGRRVALKVLPFAAMLDRQQLARFKNEARAAATLDHPNIVAIHSVGCERGVHYYAMQLIEGQSLAQVVEQIRAQSKEQGAGSKSGVAEQGSSGVDEQRTGYSTTPLLHSRSSADTAPIAHLSTFPAPCSFPALDFRTIAQLGIQAAEALDHAHQNGILHRDVKPANLLVECSGIGNNSGSRDARDGIVANSATVKLWVTDFGLARMEQDAGMTMTGDPLGTLRYMSPEQALAKRVVVDHRSDVYSLGVTLYELLTLQPAYRGDDRQELLRQIAFNEPRKPRAINARIPHDLETIVLKAIEKNPADRYTAASELADDLQSFLHDQPIKAKPPTWRELAMKWSQHHPAAVWAAVLFLLATAIVSAASTVLITGAYNREAAQRELADARLHAETEARNRADTESARAKAVSDLFREIIFSPSKGWRIKGSQYTAREMFDDFAANLGDQLADQPEAEAELRHSIGCSYIMLGVPERAEPHFKRAIELGRTLDSPKMVSLLADSLAIYAKNLFLQRRYDEAEPLLREALEMYHQQGVRGTMPITVCRDLQLVLAAAGRHDEAERAIQQAWAEMQGYDELPPEFAQSPYADVSGTCAGFAYYFATIGREAEAAKFLRRATLAERRLQKPFDSLAALLYLALARLRLGDQSGYREACRVLVDPPVHITGKDSFLSDEFHQSRIFTCCLGPDAVDDPSVLVKQAEEFAAHNSMQAPYIDLDLVGRAHYRAGHYQDAAQYLEQAIAQSPSDAPPSHGTATGTQLFLAMTKWRLGQHDDARRLLREVQPAIDKERETPTLRWGIERRWNCTAARPRP